MCLINEYTWTASEESALLGNVVFYLCCSMQEAKLNYMLRDMHLL